MDEARVPATNETTMPAAAKEETGDFTFTDQALSDMVVVHATVNQAEIDATLASPEALARFMKAFGPVAIESDSNNEQ